MTSSSAGPSVLMRKVGGPLLLYHVLILLGAFVLLRGVFVASVAWEAVGSGLIVGGILVEASILYWTAGLARAGVSAGLPPPVPGARAVPDVRERWFCLGCARIGPPTPGAICPRCGRSMIPWAASGTPGVPRGV